MGYLDGQGLFRLYYDRKWKSEYRSGQNSKLILLVNSCECELFLMVFLIDIEKNVCSRIMASYRVLEAILICSSKYTTYGMAAAKGLSLG